MLGYLVLTGAMICLFWRKVDHASGLLAAHAAGATVLVMLGRTEQNRVVVFARSWYPLVYIGLCYREMSILIAAIRSTHADAELARLDAAIWHAQPSVWLGPLQLSWLTELLQIAYALFVPSVVLVGALLWARDRRRFRSYAFLITLGFLVSYVGYLLVPARGPRYFLAGMYAEPLRGVWLQDRLRALLDVLESAHYDCMPSGHIEMTALAWWAARRISAPMGMLYAVYTAVIAFATIYLRYHYTVDLAAGLAVAAGVAWISPWLEEKLSRGSVID